MVAKRLNIKMKLSVAPGEVTKALFRRRHRAESGRMLLALERPRSGQL